MASSPSAVLLYEGFCMFEISVALSVLHQGGHPVITCSVDGKPLRSEDGITLVPDQPIRQMEPDQFGSLLLPGAADIRSAVEDGRVLDFIRQFAGKPIGAISIAPVLLVKAGVMGHRRWMAGVTRKDLMEEGFTGADLQHMVDWDDLLAHPIPAGYITDENILTSIAYHFVPFGIKFGEMVGVSASIRDYVGTAL